MLLHNPKIYKTETIRNCKLKNVFVDYPDEDIESLPSDLKTQFIGKYLPFRSKNNQYANINPFFMELMLNMSLKSSDCNSVKNAIFDGMSTFLLFDKALGDLTNAPQRSFTVIKSQICSLIRAVKYLHSRRIIHGDIKPSNVLYFENNVVKLADFGSSAFILSGNENNFERRMFTRNYRPLEVWEDNSWGFSSDIWALACTIFYMVYGTHLFPDQPSDDCYISCLKTWEAHCENLIGNSIQLPTNWSNPEFFQINCLIVRMLNPNKEGRPSIFDVEIEMLKNIDNSLAFLSSSPDSVCRYHEIMRCNDVMNCRFDKSKYVAPSMTQLEVNLSEFSKEYSSLVIMIYYYFSTIPTFDQELLRVCEIIASSLTGTRIDHFSITNRHIERIKTLLMSRKFFYFNWMEYFRVTG